MIRIPVTGSRRRLAGLRGRSANRNKVYAVWEDAVPSEPTIGHVLYSQSTDAGRSWSPGIVISKSPAGVDAWDPTVEVNSSGTVGVTYVDFRNNTPGGAADTDHWLVRCASACTTPLSWVETHVAGPFDMHLAPVARGEFIGDYMGMTTSGNAFQPFFIQTVDASNPTDAYFAETSLAPVAIEASAARVGPVSDPGGSRRGGSRLPGASYGPAREMPRHRK